MDEGRLGEVRRTENNHRKYVCLLNDAVRAKWTTYDDSLKKWKSESENRLEKSSVLLRRAYVRQKVLKQCMKMRRESRQGDVYLGRHARNFGVYGGKPIDAFGKDIDSFIRENHPRLRRERRTKELLTKSIEKGAILKKETVEERMGNYFAKHLAFVSKRQTKKKEPEEKKEKTGKEQFQFQGDKRFGLLRLPVLINPFTTMNLYRHKDEEEDVNVLSLSQDVGDISISERHGLNKTDDEKRKSVDSGISNLTGSDVNSSRTGSLPSIGASNLTKPKLQKSGTKQGLLILPPIQPTKSLVQSK